MANMSYCRFENTLRDFKDCLDKLEDHQSFQDMDLSEFEALAMHRLAVLARRYIEHFTQLQERAEYEAYGKVS